MPVNRPMDLASSFAELGVAGRYSSCETPGGTATATVRLP
jgi:hypothetical protein